MKPSKIIMLVLDRVCLSVSVLEGIVLEGIVLDGVCWMACVGACWSLSVLEHVGVGGYRVGWRVLGHVGVCWYWMVCVGWRILERVGVGACRCWMDYVAFKVLQRVSQWLHLLSALKCDRRNRLGRIVGQSRHGAFTLVNVTWLLYHDI
ncbi:uncharacterized [Tachysurus ichikawai]